MKKRRFFHGRSYNQMIEDGDLPTDRAERLGVIMAESFIRGLEQGGIVVGALLLFGAICFGVSRP